MLVYRFRVTSEEHDGFLREIEIQPNQTFLDFHFTLMEVSDLRSCEKASFFKTDLNFKKLEEFTLKPEKRQVRRYDDDIGEVVAELTVLRQMKNIKIKDLIEDPHQKLLYEFRAKNNHLVVLQIELFKILHSDGLRSLPACIRQTGELPKPVIPVASPNPTAGAVQVPVPPKPVIPKPLKIEPVIPSTSVLEKLDAVEENEAELAEIESQLEELLVEDSPEVFESAHTEANEEGFGHEEEVTMEHIDDIEDIDRIDNHYGHYQGDQEQDDY